METTALIIPLLILFGTAFVALAAKQEQFGKLLLAPRLGWLLALAPATAFGLLLNLQAQIAEGGSLTWQIEWLPQLSLNLGLYFDGLSALFALIVTGIGTLILIYAGYYFKGDASAWRFFTYLLLFMTAMLGLVMAGDALTLFIFWEGTSVTSFLLVAYKYKYEDARAGAFRALFITVVGGIALLLGLLLVSYVAGSTDFAIILTSGESLRGSFLYPAMLLLVAAGAFTKSAQFPFHFWLPGAMSAPTPASAYLHSATMVKAGIYLLARLNPALGETSLWFWLLTITGAVTMMVGAFLGLKNNDLKGLLAYSTISQLGILVLLIGQTGETAFKALVVGILAHALYKSALFMVAGTVDHEAGTRDLSKLGGLRKKMPVTFAIATLAALSLAGLPPLFGFLAKETLLAAAIYDSIPTSLIILLPAAVVIAAAFKLAQAGLLVVDGFMGEPKDTAVFDKAHEAPYPMLLAPAIPAVFSLALGVLPEPASVVNLLANAAAASYGDKVKVSLALWTDFNIPLLLSVIAIGGGFVFFALRGRWRPALLGFGNDLSLSRAFARLIGGIDRGAFVATRLQNGRLRLYLSIMISVVVLLVFGLAGPVLPSQISGFTFDLAGEFAFLRLVTLFVAVGTALAAIFLKRDIYAILAFTISGLGIAVYMILEPAPDIALVQIVVDIMALVILVLALTRLPQVQRREAAALSQRRQKQTVWRDAIVAVGAGLVVTMVSLIALTSRPRASAVSPFFADNAKGVGAKDIVGAIVVDFRALDTMLEIAVFSLAGLGIYTLLTYATKKHKDEGTTIDALPKRRSGALGLIGIEGMEMSPFLNSLAYLTLPFTLVLGATHMMYGHDQPGDGFTAGVIISLGVGLWYVVFGFDKTRERLRWMRSSRLTTAGLLTAVGNGIVTHFLTGSFLGSFNYGDAIGLPLPAGFYLSSAFIFEVAICLTVMGSVGYMLSTLGHPKGSSQYASQKEAGRTSSDPLSIDHQKQPDFNVPDTVYGTKVAGD